MAITTEQYQQMMNFMDGNMSLDVITSFENELRNNPELRLQLDFEQSIRDNIGSAKNITGESNDQQKFFTIHNNKSFSFKSSGIKLMAAATISIVIIAGVSMLLVHKKNVHHSLSTTVDTAKRNNEIVLGPLEKPIEFHEKKATINTDSLFKKYYKKEPPPQEYPILLAEVFEDYEKNNYASLDKLNLEKIPATRGADDAGNKKTILLLGNFYKGVADLERKKTSKAIEHLTWVINNSKDVGWQEKGHWYLAMAFLENGNIDNAQKELNKITKTGKYNLMAKQILKTITSNSN